MAKRRPWKDGSFSATAPAAARKGRGTLKYLSNSNWSW